MKIWVIKQFIMTRSILKTATILLVLTWLPFHSSASADDYNNSMVTSQDIKLMINDHHGGKGTPLQPGSHDATHLPKAKPPHMDELPHIHRFHKERVKKMVRHHGRCWLLSQVIIVLCHLSILLIAWMHVTH